MMADGATGFSRRFTGPADISRSPRWRAWNATSILAPHDGCSSRCSEFSRMNALARSLLRRRLSARELECLRWVAAGKTDWEISVILSISAATVRFHLDRARAKLGARTRAQAVARLVLHGLF